MIQNSRLRLRVQLETGSCSESHLQVADSGVSTETQWHVPDSSSPTQHCTWEVAMPKKYSGLCSPMHHMVIFDYQACFCETFIPDGAHARLLYAPCHILSPNMIASESSLTAAWQKERGALRMRGWSSTKCNDANYLSQNLQCSVKPQPIESLHSKWHKGGIVEMSLAGISRARTVGPCPKTFEHPFGKKSNGYAQRSLGQHLSRIFLGKHVCWSVCIIWRMSWRYFDVWVRMQKELLRRIFGSMISTRRSFLPWESPMLPSSKPHGMLLFLVSMLATSELPELASRHCEWEAD